MEFACILPIIVIILASALEIGGAIHVLSALQSAAREGARHSVIQGATQTSVDEVCQTSLTGIKNPQVSITPDPESATPGSFIQVTVSASATENSWTRIMNLFGSKTLTSTVTMRKE